MRFSSSGCSCCVQWPQRGMVTTSRSSTSPLHRLGQLGTERRVPLGDHHQRRDRDARAGELGRLLPVAVEIAIPVDAAREAGAGEGVDVDLQVGVGEQRLAERLRILHHLDQVRHAAAGREPRLDVRERHAPPHELAEHTPHVAGERRLGDARLPGSGRCSDCPRTPRASARRAASARAADTGVLTPDHARGPRRMEQRHHPDDEAAPVVADEHGALDVERVEQADEVARQMAHVVRGDVVRTVAVTVAALVGRERAEAGRRRARESGGARSTPARGSRGRARRPGRCPRRAPRAICRSWRRRDS